VTSALAMGAENTGEGGSFPPSGAAIRKRSLTRR
jgi:hypothetical protein